MQKCHVPVVIQALQERALVSDSDEVRRQIE
jgi:hypothetical protein